MATLPTEGVNAEHPWPGLLAFGEEAQHYFHGRDGEAAELLRLVQRATLSVLFGQSGLGKTSLLQAGLFPLLRQQDLLPVPIRLDLGADAEPLAKQVRARLRQAASEHGAEFSGSDEGSLWEFLHARSADLWGPRNRLLTPVLVFDQFEEIFTLGRHDAATAHRCSDFMRELADVVEQRLPQSLAHRLDDEPALAEAYTLQRPLKVVLSFREDHLADFEALRPQMPSVMQNRMRLTRMSAAQAREAVLQSGGALVSAAVATRIIDFVASARGGPSEADDVGRAEIEPSLLSVVCRELNSRRIEARQPQLTTELLDSGAPQQIIAEFYERSFAGLDPAVRAWVEDQLLTSGGYRSSEAVEDAERRPGVSRAAIDVLVARRLLRLEDRFGVVRVELTHDLLTGVARESRDRRAQVQAAALLLSRNATRRRRLRYVIAASSLGGALVVGLAAVLVVLYQSSRREVESQGRMLLTDASAGIERGISGRPGALLAQALRVSPHEPRIVARAVTLLTEHAYPSLQVQRPWPELLARPTGMAWRPGGWLELSTATEAARINPDTLAIERLIFDEGGADKGAKVQRRIGFEPGTARSSANPDAASAPASSPATAYDADHQVVVRLDAQGRGVVHDLRHGRVIGTTALAMKNAGTLEVSRDLGWFAYVDAEGRIAVQTADGGTTRAVPPIAGKRLRPSGVAAAANTLLLASDDGYLRVAVWRAGKYEVTRLPGGLSRARLLADGKTVIARRGSTQLRRIDLDAASQWHESFLLRSSMALLSYDVSSDEKLVATGALDGTARVIDLASGDPVGPPMRHQGAVLVVRFVQGGELVATGASDRGARLWRVGSDRPLVEPAIHPAGVVGIAVDDGATRMATWSDDGNLSLWQLPSRTAGRDIDLGATIADLALSPDGSRLAAALEDGSVALLALDPQHAEQARELWRSPAGAASIDSIGFRGDGLQLAIGRDDGSTLCLAVPDGAVQARLEAGSSAGVKTLRYSPDGTLLAVASDDHAVRLWNVAAQKLVGRPLPHQGVATRLHFSPDGRQLASTDAQGNVADEQIHVWDTQTATESAPPRKMSAGDRVAHLAWPAGAGQPLVIGGAWEQITPVVATESSDGNTVFAGDIDGVGLLADVAKGSSRRGAPMQHDSIVVQAAFSSDGQWLTTSAADGTARVWDARSGFQVSDALPREVGLPAFVANGGRTLVTVVDPTNVQLLEAGLDFPLPEPTWLAELAEAQTGAAMDARGFVRLIADRKPRLVALRARIAAEPPGWWRTWGLARIDSFVTTGPPAKREATISEQNPSPFRRRPLKPE